MKNYCLIFTCLLLIAPVHSKSNHLLKHVEALSRDYFYINLSRDTVSYKHQTIVGGEHENHYFILGFEDDIFTIKLHSEEGNIGNVPQDDSHQIVAKHWDEEKQLKVFTVKVIEQQTWIKVSLSAHPFASYSIEVEKFNVSEL